MKKQLIDFLNSENTLCEISKNSNFFENSLHDSMDKKNILSFMKSDPSFFIDVLSSLIDLRKNSSFQSSKNKDLVNALNENGVVTIKNFLSLKSIEKVLDFQNWYLQLLGKEANYGGKVNFSRDSLGRTIAKNNKFSFEHGELRCQSKSLGFHPPGVEEIIQDPRINSIAQEWFKNPDAKIWRSTLSYLTPSKNVHIPWHFDDFQDTIKIFVFLEDVDVDNGPMTYAYGSQSLDKKYIREMKHNFFCNGKTVIELQKQCAGWVKDSDPKDLELESVTIGDCTYQNRVLTGKKGDVAFFDVSGLHSGNIAVSGNRKVLVLSFPTRFSPLNKFINFLNS